MIRSRWIRVIVTVVISFSLVGSSVFATEGTTETKPAKNGWEGQYYYKNGVKVTGPVKIGKKMYYFDKRTGKARAKGFIKDGSREYYSTGKGKLATGFKAIKNKKGKLNGYYFYKSGKNQGLMAKNTVIGHLKIPKSGRLHEAYGYGIKTLNKKGWKLRAAYKYAYKTRYQGRWYRVSSKTKMKSEKYSLKGFKNRKGNCYVMAAEFYVMAKLLGYDVRQVYGRVSLPHSWTEIRHKSGTYVYDPNFRNETGRNGWKIWYGKKGTWRYHKKGNLNNFVKAPKKK